MIGAGRPGRLHDLIVINWPDRERAFHAPGVDGIQALVLALERAAMDLAASPEANGGLLTFLGGTNLMLKVFPNVSDIKS